MAEEGDTMKILAQQERPWPPVLKKKEKDTVLVALLVWLNAS